MKQIFTNLKVFLTLLLLCGVGSMWAETVSYMQTAADKASVSNGNAPEGSSVTFKNTYTSNKEQLTKGNTMTLTLKGYAGCKITGLTLYMKSNKNAGSGYMSMVAGSTTLAAIGSSSSGVAFNDASWYGSYTTEYKDVTPTLIENNYQIKNGEDVVITIGATVNSLYCQKFTITYEAAAPSTDPSISASDVTLESDATSGEIAYTIANPVEGKSLTATTDAEWISNLTVGAGKVTFSTTANAGAERTADVTLKYEGATDKVVKVTQKKPMPVYESLAALVNAGKPTEAGETVKVTLTNEVITDIDISGQYRNGIYLKSGDQEVEIYCWNVPKEWIVGGTVSGTLTCPWKLYEKTNTWELCPESWEDLTYTAPAGVYEVVIDELENGSITANPATAVKGTEITLTVTPNLHYSLKEGSLIVLDEEGAEVPVTNYKFTMPASDVLVGAEFEEAPKCTVLYSSLGEEVGDGEEVYVGECVTSLPTPTNTPDGWTFAGWTANESYEMSSTAPVMFTATTPVEEDLILYAVFCKSEGGSTSSYEKVTTALTDWRGDYLIAYSAEVFMDGGLAGGKDGVGKTQTHVDPEDALSEDGMTVDVSWGDEHYVTLEAIDDTNLAAGYVIKSHSTDTPYFYHTANSNGMSGTDKKSTAANYPISIVFNDENDIDIALGGAAAGAVLHYNKAAGSTGEMFRFYKNGGQENVYLYKKQGSGVKIYTISLAQSHDVTITSAGYATAYVPFAATVEGATAYYVTVSGSTATLNKIEGTIPANTGVILEGEEGTATLKASANTPESVDGNLLIGTVKEEGEDFDDLGFTYYILSDGEYGVGFYWDGEDYDEFEGMGAHCDQYKAILAVPETVGAPNFFSLDGEATAIQNVEDAQMKNAAAFNLAGQVVNRDYKGIVIMNGKKFLNK